MESTLLFYIYFNNFNCPAININEVNAHSNALPLLAFTTCDSKLEHVSAFLYLVYTITKPHSLGVSSSCTGSSPPPSFPSSYWNWWTSSHYPSSGRRGNLHLEPPPTRGGGKRQPYKCGSSVPGSWGDFGGRHNYLFVLTKRVCFLLFLESWLKIMRPSCSLFKDMFSSCPQLVLVLPSCPQLNVMLSSCTRLKVTHPACPRLKVPLPSWPRRKITLLSCPRLKVVLSSCPPLIVVPLSCHVCFLSSTQGHASGRMQVVRSMWSGWRND